MDELLPVLVARVVDEEDAYPVIEAALRRGIAFLPLDEPPAYDGTHVLEVHVRAWTEPLLFLAEPAGDPIGGQHPLAVQPFAPEHVEVLQVILGDAGIRVSLPPPPEAAPVVDIRLSELPPSEPPPRLSLPPAQLEGRVLGDKYLIEHHLGSGAMGSVFQGTHLALRKPIAVKILHPSHLHDEEFIEAFHREALAASRLDHPNVVQVLDFGHEPDGLLYIVMELLAGSDLRSALEREPLPSLPRIVEVMTQVTAALSASHDRDVVHRDVKPENIILVPKRQDDGSVRDVAKVCDFGIAEIVERRSILPGDEVKREVAGTPDYMAPEQVQGGAVDVRTDVYACGVVLYEMATGKVPFHAAQTPEEIAWSHVQKPVPPPSVVNPAVDRRLEALIMKALAKDPAERHQTARALWAELRALEEAARRSALLDSFSEDDDAVSLGAAPGIERDDAIDIGDLFSLDPRAQPPASAPKPQIWVLSEQMATALIQDPAAVLKRVEALADDASYAREMSTLERAMASAATRGAAPAVLVAVTHLLARSRGVAPGERSREAIAARALRAIARPEMLQRVAEDALDGPPAGREPARRLLVTLGEAGVLALAAAREHAAAHGPGWPGRPRFVAAVREAGVAALSPLAAFLHQARSHDHALLEDLLRAVPELPSPQTAHPAVEPLGTLLATQHLRSESPAVRRAAAVALSAVWGARANAWLGPLLEDDDDGLRIAALGALRRHGGVDREVVRRIDRVLSGQIAGGSELRIAAAFALVDTTGPARLAAVDTLLRVVRPAGGTGFFNKLVAVELTEDPAVMANLCQVLLTLSGGPEPVRAVEARAAKAGGELKRTLTELLARAR